MYEYPFTLPPYYTAVIRCLGVLEGVALQVDPTLPLYPCLYPYPYPYPSPCPSPCPSTLPLLP